MAKISYFLSFLLVIALITNQVVWAVPEDYINSRKTSCLAARSIFSADTSGRPGSSPDSGGQLRNVARGGRLISLTILLLLTATTILLLPLPLWAQESAGLAGSLSVWKQVSSLLLQLGWTHWAGKTIILTVLLVIGLFSFSVLVLLYTKIMHYRLDGDRDFDMGHHDFSRNAILRSITSENLLREDFLRNLVGDIAGYANIYLCVQLPHDKEAEVARLLEEVLRRIYQVASGEQSGIFCSIRDWQGEIRRSLHVSGDSLQVYLVTNQLVGLFRKTMIRGREAARFRQPESIPELLGVPAVGKAVWTLVIAGILSLPGISWAAAAQPAAEVISKLGILWQILSSWEWIVIIVSLVIGLRALIWALVRWQQPEYEYNIFSSPVNRHPPREQPEYTVIILIDSFATSL